MTMQIKDEWFFEDDLYIACDVEHKNSLFVPNEYGFKPIAISSACNRGYYCSYLITKNNIVLKRLHIKDENNYYPQLVNALPRNYEKLHNCVYEDVNLLVEYTGRIILCNSLISDDILKAYEVFGLYFRRNRSVIFHYYKNTLELVFHKGKLISVTDLSKQCQKLRKIISDNPCSKNKKPSEKERYSDDLLSLVFNKDSWWMHKEITADMVQAERQFY